jgi:ABC-type amino acid transport substrate-binding protein
LPRRCCQRAGADESELAELLQNALDAIRRRGELQQIFAQYGVSLKTL